MNKLNCVFGVQSEIAYFSTIIKYYDSDYDLNNSNSQNENSIFKGDYTVILLQLEIQTFNLSKLRVLCISHYFGTYN